MKRLLILIAWLVLPGLLAGCGDSSHGEALDVSPAPDTGISTDAGRSDAVFEDADGEDTRQDVARGDMPAGDGPGGADSHAGGVTSTLVASGCSASFVAGRVLVHYNTSLGIIFTDAKSPYAVRGTLSLGFPVGFTGAIPNPYSWVASGVHKEVAVTDKAYVTWGNHCWKPGESPTGGSATIDVIDGPQGIARVTFHAFQLRNCIDHSATCTLNGTVETQGTGTYN